MEITFHTGEEIDKGVTLFNLNSIYTKVKTLNRFSIKELSIEDLNNSYQNRTTYIPLIIKKIDSIYIKKLTEKEFNVPVENDFNKYLFEKFNKYFDQILPVEKKTLEINANVWKANEIQIINSLKEIFADIEKLYKFIHVYATNYGHSSSYYYDEKSKQLHIYWNINSSIKQIVYTILLSTLLCEQYKRWLHNEIPFMESGNWKCLISTVGYIINLPLFNKIFPDQISTTFVDENAYQEKRILDLLSLDQKGITFDLNENTNVIINGVEINSLTVHEDKLLRYLIKNNGKFCTNEDISILLWGNNYTSKYSIYYIPKLIFTLKKKISLKGISPDFIKAKRGIGYTIET